MVPCGQCGKPAVQQIGDVPLCVECLLKYQQAEQIKFNRLASRMNYLLGSMEDAVGLPGLYTRYEIPRPLIHHGPVTLNNIKVNESVVGAINTGDVKNIDVVIDYVRNAGNKKLEAALKNFTQAMLDEKAINDEARRSLLEQISFISSQIALPKEQRSPGIVKAVLGAIKNAVSTIAPLISLWEKLSPLLNSIFP